MHSPGSIVACIVMLIVAATPLIGHHSVSASHDKTRVTTITGTVTGIEWRNPHAGITLVSRNGNGESLVRRVEMAGPARLIKTGFQVNDVKIGDTVAFEVWLPKDEPRFQGLGPAGKTLILSDGRRFDVADNWADMIPGAATR
jgi:hypothetical protein